MGRFKIRIKIDEVKRLIILPFAETDIKVTVSYFKEVSDALDRDFIQEIDASFFEILSNPAAFQ